MKNLNSDEQRILQSLKKCDLFGDRPTGLIEDFQCDDYSLSQMKGYVSSLSKKGYIIDCEMPSGMTAWQAL